MREAIKLRLAAEISALEGRCYEPYELATPADKPFVTIRMAEEAWDTPWTGIKRIFEVTAYSDTLTSVDMLLDEAVRSLHRIRLSDGSGSFFTCLWEGTVQAEGFDAEQQAVFRTIRFSVRAIRPQVDASIGQEPWLEATAAWTEGLVDPEWGVYRTYWPQDYKPRSVLWRTKQVDVLDKGTATVEIRKKLIGHVIAPDEQERLLLLTQLSVTLARTSKLHIGSERSAEISEIISDMRKYPFRCGQLSLTLSSRIAVSGSTELPIMAGIHAGANIF
ncbi:hypothetical protein [Paenibacillus thalictri]|uniref:Uncharacterized protein n=1 Tax=Paenibacillus thalictri TaxID=2527873 RepID=A0A4Q9DGE0_9BACL|nr:hypothetical protein [Paenibacillus thalictri]TBL71357.1 hypothetical protein EYB31_30145 [Paenibacillus thalictri]